MVRIQPDPERAELSSNENSSEKTRSIIQMVTHSKLPEDYSHLSSQDYFILKKELESYRRITSNVKGFIWALSYEANPEGESYFSESIKNLTGYSADEINSKAGRVQSLIHAEDAFNIRKQITDFENNPTQNSISLVYRIVNKTNDIIWIKDNISVERNAIGKIIRYDGIVSDISEIKNSEEKAKISEERLKQLNNAKDRFISIISHDLRAPFTSILGFAEILLNEASLPESERQEYLNYIFESSQNQLHMVNYLLDWSRLQTGRMKMEPQRLKARTIVENCISTLTGNAIRKSIEIKTYLPEEIFIQADEKLISQAITNLLSNAIKFTEPYKSIEVSVNHFKKGFVEFVVKDEGVGISEENQTKLFKFEQKFTLEGTKGEKGSGLGLTLVKEIVEKHGGDIWFYSAINKGSEFHFIIPEASNILLLVEDDPASRNLWQRIVNKDLPNFEIMLASNGYEAMTMIQEATPTIVITDHNMPLMNGIQLIESIRKKEETHRIPVIIVAALLTDEQREKYYDLGVEAILDKPLDINEFSRALQEVIK
ncbi:MAG: response regulator [Bacteroidota bacterium]|nr:response regulator [Bacteroidota bacterium]MDP4192138.1 response regulator [Bacteroidota bacterium]MDP4194098.1 response regulator [Bacteroidota bacterium]